MIKALNENYKKSVSAKVRCKWLHSCCYPTAGPLPQLTVSSGLVFELQMLSATVALLLLRSTHITLRVIMPK